MSGDRRYQHGSRSSERGWALYAEQLAEEMGLYETDPLGQIGYLHDALWRGSRLVMDSGLHAMRWSREQAIRSMKITTNVLFHFFPRSVTCLCLAALFVGCAPTPLRAAAPPDTGG